MAIIRVANVHHDASGFTRTQISAANTYTVYTSNSQRLTIGPTGNVGVGTASPASNFHVSGDAYVTGTIDLGNASDTTISRLSAGDLAVEGNRLYRAGGTDVALADGGTGASLTDPNADRILFWDDSAGAVTWLTAGSGLKITDTIFSSNSGIDLLTSGSVTSAATLDIVLSSYTMIKGFFIVVDLRPVTDADNINLLMRTSTDGGATYAAGASDYSYAIYRAAGDNEFSGGGLSSNDSSVQIARDVGGLTKEYVQAFINIYNPTETSRWPVFQYSGAWVTDAAVAGMSTGSGIRKTAQNTDAVRFLFSSGNIAAGTYRVYGYM